MLADGLETVETRLHRVPFRPRIAWSSTEPRRLLVCSSFTDSFAHWPSPSLYKRSSLQQYPQQLQDPEQLHNARPFKTNLQGHASRRYRRGKAVPRRIGNPRWRLGPNDGGGCNARRGTPRSLEIGYDVGDAALIQDAPC